MSTTPQNTNAATSLDLLRSIDGSLKTLIAMMRPLVPTPVASDRDLDGAYGNPEVRLMPKDWHGADYKGRRMADCPADLLDLIAEMHDYFAGRAEADNKVTTNGKPVATYERADAARARGWAKRIRDGKHTPVADDAQADLGNGDDINW